MYLGSSYDSGAPATGEVLNGKAAKRDDESRLAATLRRTRGAADEPAAPRHLFPANGESSQKNGQLRAAVVAAEIARTIEGRLPARIRNLRVQVKRDQFVLCGVSSSYYVKQLAGHLAMTTLETRMLGRLVNEIEVRTVR